MLIFFAMLVPVVTLVYLYMYHRKKIAWWEAFPMLMIPFLCIWGIKIFSQNALIWTTETWNAYGTVAKYYEDWDEEVHCRHPIYVTVSHTDSEGRTYTTQEIVGYMHAYDVDYHPPHWRLDGSCGENFSISHGKYQELRGIWGNEKFQDLNRDYHSNDGDMYYTTWNSTISTIEPITTVHNYKNKVKSSDSVFNFKKINKKTTQVYDYMRPGFFEYSCNFIYNWSNATDQLLLRRWNAYLGAKKKVVIMIIPYIDKPLTAAFDQEAYWKGGNKNELIVCVGITKNKDISWVKAISWTPQTTLKAQIEREVNEIKVLNMSVLINYLGNTVQGCNGVIRRDFEEFNYLSVPVPWWGILIAFIVSLGCSILLAGWSGGNKYDA